MLGGSRKMLRAKSLPGLVHRTSASAEVTLWLEGRQPGSGAAVGLALRKTLRASGGAAQLQMMVPGGGSTGDGRWTQLTQASEEIGSCGDHCSTKLI